LQESANIRVIIPESVIIQARLFLEPSAGEHIGIANGTGGNLRVVFTEYLRFAKGAVVIAFNDIPLIPYQI
jgi:hypothetical protein